MDKNLIKTSFRIPHSVYHSLKIHCATREISMGVVAAIAIEQYIDKYEKVIKKPS